MRGETIDDMITDSALFLSEARAFGAETISIGDGGNEMGMGTYRHEIEAHVPCGKLILCQRGGGYHPGQRRIQLVGLGDRGPSFPAGWSVSPSHRIPGGRASPPGGGGRRRGRMHKGTHGDCGPFIPGRPSLSAPLRLPGPYGPDGRKRPGVCIFQLRKLPSGAGVTRRTARLPGKPPSRRPLPDTHKKTGLPAAGSLLRQAARPFSVFLYSYSAPALI